MKVVRLHSRRFYNQCLRKSKYPKIESLKGEEWICMQDLFDGEYYISSRARIKSTIGREKILKQCRIYGIHKVSMGRKEKRKVFTVYVLMQKYFKCKRPTLKSIKRYLKSKPKRK